MKVYYSVYESRRSQQGEEIDKKLIEQKVICEIQTNEVSQKELIDSYESIIAEDYEIA